MAFRQEATLNLAVLLSHAPGAPGEVAGEGQFMPGEAVLVDSGMRLDGPLSWRLTVSRTGGEDDFLVEGNVEGTALLECRRCLTEVPTAVESSFLYPMSYRPGIERLMLAETDDDEEDRLLFGRPEVDFAPMLTQVLAIDLPLTVLCKESCKGLSLDGVNLNEHPEQAQEPVRPEGASPFAALKDLDL